MLDEITNTLWYSWIGFSSGVTILLIAVYLSDRRGR